MNNRFLVLYLEGPLQSWGCNSCFDKRETLSYPTESGIFGMLLAASGDSGSQVELLKQMSENIIMTVYCFKNETKMLRDYQVIGNGYNINNPWENNHILKKRDGKNPRDNCGKVTGKKITHRYYLQNARFCVILQMSEDLANKFSVVLQMPVYDLCLGRKNCVPTAMIFRGAFSTENEAKKKIYELIEQNNLEPSYLVRNATTEEIEIGHGKENYIELLNDVPVSFGIHKQYRDRFIVKQSYSIENL